MKLIRSGRRALVCFVAGVAALLGGTTSALLGTCGPFTDTANDAFCPFVLEVFYLGITTGTTATTYDPTSNVSRTQMAAFLSRGVDGVLKRGSRRAALNRFWTTQNPSTLGVTTVGGAPRLVQSDGLDVWVGNNFDGTVSRVRGSDTRLLETWTGATGAYGVLTAMNRVLVTGQIDPGRLYLIDPSQTAGAVTTVATNLGTGPSGIAFDGARVWTANLTPTGSISIITPGAIPWTVTTLSVGVGSTAPIGALYDGANIWVTDHGLGALVKLNNSGAVLQTVTIGGTPGFPIFDGANIWVPNNGSTSVAVVRASTGSILQTLSGNGLDGPLSAAFDGERVLITNFTGNSVSLWKAADLTPLGTFLTGPMTSPDGACSDGSSFWITLVNAQELARF